MSKFREQAERIAAEREARGPVTWVVRAIIDGELEEIERVGMTGWEVSFDVKHEFESVRVIEVVEKR